MEIQAFKTIKESFSNWKILVILGLFLFSFSPIANAAIRDTLTYQGKILDSSMLPPVDGSYNMQFTIYDSLAAGNLLWTETWNAGNQVSISDGVFTVELNNICASWTGACASNGGVNWSTDSLYLQIGFDADGNGSFEETFAPRKRFTAVPYAQMAARLETASNILFTDNTDHSLVWNQAADRTLTVENTNGANVANLSVEGQVRVGQFAAAPAALGNGALYYDTGDDNLYLYQNSAWQIVGGGGGDSIWDADTDTGVQTEEGADEDKIRFDIGNTSGTAYPDILVLDGTNGFVWNDGGAAALDFRIEGDTNANLLFVDASADKVGLGTNAPEFLLDLISGMQIGNAMDTDQDLMTVDNGDSLANRPSMNYAKDIFFAGLDGFVFNNPNGSNTMMANSVDSYAYMLANSQNNAREVEFLASHNTDPTTYTNLYAHAFGLMPTTQYPYLAYQRGATSRHYLDVIISGTNITDIVFNDSSYDANFRIEGNNNANLFYLDAGTDRVALGNNSPNAFLDISSNIASALRLNPYGAVAGNSAELQFMELVANGSNYVGFKAPDSITTSLAWVLPNADGAAGAFLKTDGAGNLGWATSLKSLWDADADTGIQVEESADDDTIRFDLGTTASDALKLTQTAGFVWNDSGLDTLDVRMESDTDANLFFLDAGNNNIGIGEAAPDVNAKLEVAGNVMMDDYLYFQNTTTDYLRFDGSDFTLTNDLLPSADKTYNLGSSTLRWKKAYLGKDSLHIGVDGFDYDISYDDVGNALLFNDNSENIDLRLEGDTNANLFFVDAGLDSVAVGTNVIANTAVFQVDSTSKGALLPRMTNGQMTGIVGPATGLLVYDTSNNKLNYWNGTAWSPMVVESGLTLDTAYNGGRTITVDAGAIQMNGSNAADETLEVSNSANGGVLLLTNNGTGTGLALSNTANGIGMSITNAGTGNGLFIDSNNATAIALNIDSESTGTAGFSLNHQGDTSLANAGISVTASNGAGAMYLTRNQAAATTDQPLAYLEEAGAADTNVLHILNAGTGNGVFIDNNNAASIGLNIDSESTGTGALVIAHNGDTANNTGAGIQVTAENGAGGLYIYRNQVAATTDDALVEIFEDNTSDQNVLDVTNDGTGLAFYANQTNTGTTTDAAAILNSGDSNALHLAESSTTANTTGTGAALYIAGTTASTAGDGNGIANARNGYGLYMNSEESTGTNKLLGIESDDTTGGQTADTEHFYVRADGVTKVYEGNVVPDFNEDGEFGFYTSGGTRRIYFQSNGTRTYINRSGTGDYSEYFRITDPTLKRDWGTVVAMDVSGSDLGVTRSVSFKDKNVLGVVSEFGTRNNDDEEGMRHEDFNWANIAMVGQLPVKVTNQNGPIAVGDYLTTSSVIGHAMKADPGDPVLGIAMEAFSGTVNSSEGQIDCLLSRNNQGNIATLLQDLQERQTLTAEDVLAVINNESFAVNYLVMTKGEVMEGLKVHGELELDSQNIGSTVVLSGEQRVRVYFPESFRVKPIVTVSPELTADNETFFDFQYLLYDVNADGFSIKLNQPLDYDLRFNWQAFAQADYSNDFEIDIPDSTPVSNIQPLVSFDCRVDNLSACVTARDCWQFADTAKWTGSSCVLK